MIKTITLNKKLYACTFLYMILLFIIYLQCKHNVILSYCYRIVTATLHRQPTARVTVSRPHHSLPLTATRLVILSPHRPQRNHRRPCNWTDRRPSPTTRDTRHRTPSDHLTRSRRHFSRTVTECSDRDFRLPISTQLINTRPQSYSIHQSTIKSQTVSIYTRAQLDKTARI